MQARRQNQKRFLRNALPSLVVPDGQLLFKRCRLDTLGVAYVFKYKTADAKVAQVKLAGHFEYHTSKPAGLGPNNRMLLLVCDLSEDQAAE